MNEFLVLCFVFSFTFKEKKKKAELRSEVQSSASSPCPLKSRRTPGQSKQLYDLLRFIAKPPEKAVTPGPALIRRHGLAERGVGASAAWDGHACEQRSQPRGRAGCLAGSGLQSQPCCRRGGGSICTRTALTFLSANMEHGRETVCGFEDLEASRRDVRYKNSWMLTTCR